MASHPSWSLSHPQGGDQGWGFPGALWLPCPWLGWWDGCTQTHGQAQLFCCSLPQVVFLVGHLGVHSYFSSKSNEFKLFWKKTVTFCILCLNRVFWGHCWKYLPVLFDRYFLPPEAYASCLCHVGNLLHFVFLLLSLALCWERDGIQPQENLLKSSI